MRHVGYLPELYEDARSEKYKKITIQLYLQTVHCRFPSTSEKQRFNWHPLAVDYWSLTCSGLCSIGFTDWKREATESLLALERSLKYKWSLLSGTRISNVNTTCVSITRDRNKHMKKQVLLRYSLGSSKALTQIFLQELQILFMLLFT